MTSDSGVGPSSTKTTPAPSTSNPAAAASSRLPAAAPAKPAAAPSVNPADADVGLGGLLDGFSGLTSRTTALKAKVQAAKQVKTDVEQSLEAERSARSAAESEVAKLRRELEVANGTLASQAATIKANERDLTIFRAGTGKSKADADRVREMFNAYEAQIAELEQLVEQLGGGAAS